MTDGGRGGQRTDGGVWVSVVAVAWVLNDAPVTAELFPTLTAIAANCDERGRGSRQSKRTIAERTGKSQQQVGRDIASLLEAELIKEGDQSLAAHLPAGQRPVVYDVMLSKKGPKPLKKSKNPSGAKKDPTPTMEGTPTIHGTPPMDGSPTPTMHGQGPLPCMDPKEDFELDLEKDFSSPYPSSPPETVTVEEEEQNLIDDNTEIKTLADDLAAEYPAFRHTTITEAINACLADGRSLNLIAAAARHCYDDPQTSSPRRLVVEGDWWVRAARGTTRRRADPIRQNDNPVRTGQLDTKPCNHGIPAGQPCDACNYATCEAILNAHDGEMPQFLTGWQKTICKQILADRARASEQGPMTSKAYAGLSKLLGAGQVEAPP